MAIPNRVSSSVRPPMIVPEKPSARWHQRLATFQARRAAWLASKPQVAPNTTQDAAPVPPLVLPDPIVTPDDPSPPAPEPAPAPDATPPVATPAT